MPLISSKALTSCSPSYLIHSLRLTYLRHIEDPYGPRIISLHPRYLNNPHVLAAGLANTERWPELNVSPSSYPSDDESAPQTQNNRRRNASGFPGATGLKYTQTIMGPSRIGALGMRVSGKRSSTTKGMLASQAPLDTQAKRLRSDSAPTPVSTDSHPSEQPSESPGGLADPSLAANKRRSIGGSSLNNVSVPSPTNGGPASDNEQAGPSAIPPLLMRHRVRHTIRHETTQSRFSFDEASVPAVQSLNPEESSSESDEDEGSSSEDDPFYEAPEADESLDLDGDEFDP